MSALSGKHNLYYVSLLPSRETYYVSRILLPSVHRSLYATSGGGGGHSIIIEFLGCLYGFLISMFFRVVQKINI